ncbi:MAG: hypothetical protein HC797_09390 [Anaerolineales bacterium]|nr:hypothetical protein [Anaerolineales bacterium]
MNTVYLKKDNVWLYFQHPQKIISTQNSNEVREALETVEALVNDKKWHAVGFVSYEAAQAFDSKLQVHESKSFPLIWFGLYDSLTSLTGLKNGTSQIGSTFKTNQTSETYNNAIQKIKEYIANGKTYQVNYTMRLIAEVEVDSFPYSRTSPKHKTNTPRLSKQMSLQFAQHRLNYFLI